MTISKEGRVELAAILIMVLWVLAWAVSLILGKEVPTALNAVMPMAAAALLGFQLPVNPKKKEP